MVTIDLTTPPPPPTSFVDALTRRLALTLPELRLVDPASSPPASSQPHSSGLRATVREALRGSHQDYTQGPIGLVLESYDGIGRWRTAFLVLSGRTVDPQTALRWGLIDAIA